jgi:hypothetical protein
VINPSMEGGKQVNHDYIEVALAGLVGLYFGGRS